MNLSVSRAAPVRLALVVAVLVAGVLLMSPSRSRADVCVGGEVKITTAKANAPLTTSMPLTVVKRDGNICNFLRFDATAHGWVQMGAHRFRVHSIKAIDIGPTKQHVMLEVSSRNVSAARAYARHHHRRYAYLRLFVSVSVHDTGSSPGSYEQRCRVSVH